MKGDSEPETSRDVALLLVLLAVVFVVVPLAMTRCTGGAW